MSMKDLSLDDGQTQILEVCTKKELLKNDRISGLPDDILISILSLLTLKEAGITSVLSMRWRHVWAYVPSLNFCPCSEYWKKLDPREASGSELNEKQREEDNKYFRRVEQVVTSHKADIVDEFRIMVHFPPEEHKEIIDNWLRFATLRRVKRLELDLNPKGSGFHSYKFPSLSSASVQLASLQLNYVNVTGDALEKLLHDCPTLEFLSVKFSRSLVRLKVADPALKLKYLKIGKCFNIKYLQISAPNLISFDYSGPQLPSFPIISTPKLTALSISDQYGTHILENSVGLRSIFSQIEVFSIAATSQKPGLISEEFPSGPRIKTLSIDIIVH